MKMDHDKLAESIASKYGKKDAHAEGAEEASDADKEVSTEKDVIAARGMMGKTLAAALKSGDNEAIEEAVCRIAESVGTYKE